MNNTSTNDALTLEKITQMMENLRRAFYYATTETQPPGEVLHVMKTDCSPEYIVLNPDDFELFRSQVPHSVRLVHLRDYRPTKADLLDSLIKLAESAGPFRLTTKHDP